MQSVKTAVASVLENSDEKLTVSERVMDALLARFVSSFHFECSRALRFVAGYRCDVHSLNSSISIAHQSCFYAVLRFLDSFRF